MWTPKTQRSPPRLSSYKGPLGHFNPNWSPYFSVNSKGKNVMCEAATTTCKVGSSGLRSRWWVCFDIAVKEISLETGDLSVCGPRRVEEGLGIRDARGMIPSHPPGTDIKMNCKEWMCLMRHAWMAMAAYGHGHGHRSCRASMAMAEEGEGRHPLGIPLAPIRLTHICVRSENRLWVCGCFLGELVLWRR